MTEDSLHATPQNPSTAHVLNLAGKISIAFVFAGSVDDSETTSTSFDLETLWNGREDNKSAQDLRNAYVDPLDAFISDICDLKSAGMHIPLIMQLHKSPNAVADTVRISFLDKFQYSAEGHNAPPTNIKKSASCHYRESFVLFETGRFYYSICFFQDEKARNSQDELDEYGVLQLLQIAEPTYLAGDARENIHFHFDISDVKGANLLATAKKRLQAAFEGSENCICDVVKGLIGVTHVELVNWDTSLSHCLVQIDEPHLFDLVKPKSNAVDNGSERLALAGICQNVCDFPNQDASEVEDSLHPIYSDDYMAFYFRRRIFLEISKESRSLTAARPLMGICPYFFCVCLLIRFDEYLLEKVTKLIRDMAYKKTYKKKGVGAMRVAPFDALFASLETVINPLSGTGEEAFWSMIEANLKILRDFHLPFLANPFRYKTEQEMFNCALDKRSITRRFGDINALMDNYSGRIGELQRIGDSIAIKFLNVAILSLAIIQTLGIIQTTVIFKDELPNYFAYFVTILTLAVLGGFVISRILWSQRHAFRLWRRNR